MAISDDKAFDQQVAQELSPFLPGLLLRRYAGSPNAEIRPTVEALSAAVLFADISGFTALAETMAQKGIGGTEELTTILNVHFGALIDEILAFGGDIIKFAGDALLAIWPGEPADLALLATRAAACGLSAQKRFKEVAAAANSKISVRIGISAGPLTGMVVGGLNGRWEFVLTGKALIQMADTVHEAKPGDVVLSWEAWGLVGPGAQVEPVGGQIVRLISIQQENLLVGKSLPALLPARIVTLRGFVPRAVASRLEHGQTGWIGDLRRVTVLFVHFPNLNDATPIDRAQDVMQVIQEVLDRFEGNINKLSADDKGTALLAAFGTPPLAHEDDPARAAQATLELLNRFGRMNVRTSAGITTGRAFCGVIGNAARREYTMIGDVVNLGARLMQAAAGSVLCDEATYTAARERVSFEPLPPIAVKGKTNPIPVFRPVGQSSAAPAPSEVVETPMIGRESERSLVAAQIQSLATKGAGCVVVIEGGAGIGKSKLVTDVAAQARAKRLFQLRGSALAVEMSTPYFAWREIFGRLCGLEAGEGRKDLVDDAAERIRGCAGPEWAASLPLINPVLLTHFPESETTAALAGQARSARTHEFLAHLLTVLPDNDANKRKVLILEDCHWLDSASWSLALLVSQRVPSLMLVLATRPMGSQEPEEFKAILGAGGTHTMRLEALPAVDTLRLVCQRLGVARLPASLEKVLLEKAEGNPLFAEELAYAMRDSGLFATVDGECRTGPESIDLSGVHIPDTVEAAMTARIDRHSPSEQLVLKAASIIGRTFEFRILCQIYPLKGDVEKCGAMITELTHRDMLSRETAGSGGTYSFKHVLLQDVAYNLMLFSQRRQLHRALAEWLEGPFAGDLSSRYPQLAHHWSRVVDSGDTDSKLVSKAIDYLQKAGEQALRSYSNREAVHFFKEALRLLAMLPESSERDRLEFALQMSLGPPLIASKGFAAPETEKAFGRAWQLCGHLGNSSERFDILNGLWNFHVVAAKFRKATELAAEIFELAKKIPEPAILLTAHRVKGETFYWTGSPRSALRHMEQVAKLYRPDFHEAAARRTGVNPAVISAGHRAWTRWMLGYPAQALEIQSTQFALAKEACHPFSHAMAMMNATLLHQFRREATRSRELAESLISLALNEGFALWLGGATIMRGWALSQEGNVADGVEQARHGLELWQATGADLAGPYYRSLLAAAYEKAGKIEEGLSEIEGALASSALSGETWWVPDLLRLKGSFLLSLSRDNSPGSEKCFRKAISLSRRCGAKSLELRAALDLGRLLLEQGKPAEAREAVAGIYGWFREGLDTRDLLEARELLKRVDERSPQTDTRAGLPPVH